MICGFPPFFIFCSASVQRGRTLLSGNSAICPQARTPAITPGNVVHHD